MINNLVGKFAYYTRLLCFTVLNRFRHIFESKIYKTRILNIFCTKLILNVRILHSCIFKFFSLTNNKTMLFHKIQNDIILHKVYIKLNLNGDKLFSFSFKN